MKQCPQCGAPLPASALDGLCPRCVARRALAVPDTTVPLDQLGDAPPAPATLPVTVRYFGDYELLEELARGGMGVVYKARQVSLNRTVAVKMILAGHFAGDAEVKRFRTEAEAAAHLDHPNIVPIYEVGEHEGQHYFSMKLVEGGDLARNLGRFTGDPKAAARLVAQVARAVHYAHQHGILHRDLKPGNLLIDANGQPHITDFGLAKRLEVDTSLTLSGAVMGTPSFMAPEQATGKGKRLTTAVDIYSLGAILYQLLTGQPPFVAETPLETLRQVVHQDPKPPSTVCAGIDQDLGTICLKCLEKDPQRRYASANALANDLERWLRHEPIHARPTSPREHAWKWLRRRPPIFFAMASAILLCLVAGLVGVAWQWTSAIRERERADESAKHAERQRVRAEQERRNAEANFQHAEQARQQAEEQRRNAQASEQRAKSEAEKSQQAAQFMQDMLKAIQPSIALGRDTTLLKDILDQTAKRLERDLRKQPGVEAELRVTIGWAYHDLGRYAEAEAMLRQALQLASTHLGPDDLVTAEALKCLGDVVGHGSNLGEAESLLRQSVTIFKKRLGSTHRAVANSLDHLAMVLAKKGRYEEAEAIYKEVLETNRYLFGNNHPTVATSLNNVASILQKRGALDEAATMQQDALAAHLKAFGHDHPNVASALNDLAITFAKQGKFAEAERIHRESHALWRKLFGNEHPNVASSLNNLAMVLFKQGRLAESEAMHREALTMRKKLFGSSHPAIASSLSELAMVLQFQGDLAGAENMLIEALRIRQSGQPPVPRIVRQLLVDLTNLYEQWAEADSGKAPLAFEWRQKLRDFDEKSGKRTSDAN
ncbi:MAG: DUF2514 family protein [Verrucomicrobiota bacterium]